MIFPPNSDPDYDGGIVERIAAIDVANQTLIADAAAIIPRLARYGLAFAEAWQRIEGGGTRWIAVPILDSYHTLRFELHKELIQLSGRSRAAEAAAGHAA